MAAPGSPSSLDFLVSRERFLPIKTEAIIRKILDCPQFSDSERHRLRLLLEMVRARFHFEFAERLDRLKYLYDPFDPDRDTQLLRQWTPDEREKAFQELRQRYDELLTRGNYVKLTRAQLLVCMESRNRWGLAVRVDLDNYHTLDVYYRGVRQEQRCYRSWSTLFRETPYEVHVLSRLAILVRRGRPPADHAASPRGVPVTLLGRVFSRARSLLGVGRDPGREKPRPDVVLMKLFKDVVLEDLKMTTPEVRVQMKLLDKLKVGGTVAGGLTAPILKLFTAAIISPVLVLVILAGFIAALFKGVFSFLTSKTKYMQKLSSSLYYQNLANNLSALTRLVDAAEDEEAKELLLAYCLLYAERDRDFTIEELDARVERWLHEKFDLPHVDFEVDDAVRKLVDKDLSTEREDTRPDGSKRIILKVHDLPATLKRLDQWWDNYFTPNNQPG